MPWKLLGLLVVVVALGDAPTTFPSDYQQPGTPPAQDALIRGTLIGAKTRGPLAGRLLLFVAMNNRCPDDRCSCGTGTCSGDPSICKGLCVYGSIAKTNKEGVFGIRLPANSYEIYLEGAQPRKPLPQSPVAVEPGIVKELTLEGPEQIAAGGDNRR